MPGISIRSPDLIRDFHVAVARASGNPMFVAVIESDEGTDAWALVTNIDLGRELFVIVSFSASRRTILS